MKYIDAEKLIAEIERRQEQLRMCCGDQVFSGKEKRDMIVAYEELDRLRTLIASLRKEQPKEICSKCIHHEKDDDCCYYPHGGMRSKINENGVYECTGFYEKEQEQPEVDLEKEIDEKWDEFVSSEGEREDFTNIARHFYSLGLNARKEE